MKIKNVIEELNKGKSIATMAKELNIQKESLLLDKLNRAAVYFNEEIDEWEYRGGNAEKSLARDITRKIKCLTVDSAFVNEDKLDEKTDDLFILFQDYQSIKWSSLNTRKTVFFEGEFYEFLRNYSIENGFKLNALMTVLIKKGLEAYNIK